MAATLHSCSFKNAVLFPGLHQIAFVIAVSLSLAFATPANAQTLSDLLLGQLKASQNTAAQTAHNAPASTKAPLKVSKARRHQGDVFLLRGFANVFSRGLDQMGDKLQKRGIDAKVIPHGNWETALSTILANRRKHGRKPVVLIGHSLGANKAILLADALRKKRIRVDYLVTFAATNPTPIPSNVRKVTNYYFKTDGWGEPIEKGPGFRGRLKNIDFSNSKTIGHFNIEKQPRLQNQVIRNVLRFVKPYPKTG